VGVILVATEVAQELKIGQYLRVGSASRGLVLLLNPELKTRGYVGQELGQAPKGWGGGRLGTYAFDG